MNCDIVSQSFRSAYNAIQAHSQFGDSETVSQSFDATSLYLLSSDSCPEDVRDDELWADEFPSWPEYLKERAQELVGKSFGRAQFLIDMTEVAERIPVAAISSVAAEFTPEHLKEIKRLAPDSKDDARKKDLGKLRKADVARVLKSATEIAGDKPPSVRDVRKAVDQELGIDRAAKAEKTKEERNAGIELADYLRQCIGRIEGITNNLRKVPGESWTLLEETEPDLAGRLATVCESLAGLMRS